MTLTITIIRVMHRAIVVTITVTVRTRPYFPGLTTLSYVVVVYDFIHVSESAGMDCVSCDMFVPNAASLWWVFVSLLNVQTRAIVASRRPYCAALLRMLCIYGAKFRVSPSRGQPADMPGYRGRGPIRTKWCVHGQLWSGPRHKLHPGAATSPHPGRIVRQGFEFGRVALS